MAQNIIGMAPATEEHDLRLFPDGFLNPNDVRSLENLNPMVIEEGGSIYIVNGDILKLEDVGGYVKEKQGKEDTNERILELT